MERSLDAIFLRKIKRGGRDRDTKAVREDRKKKRYWSTKQHNTHNGINIPFCNHIIFLESFPMKCHKIPHSETTNTTLTSLKIHEKLIQAQRDFYKALGTEPSTTEI